MKGLTVKVTPVYAVTEESIKAGIPIAELCADSGLCDSRNAARRLAKQGGLYIYRQGVPQSVPSDRVVTKEDLQKDHFDDVSVLLRAGKKKHMRVVVR